MNERQEAQNIQDGKVKINSEKDERNAEDQKVDLTGINAMLDRIFKYTPEKRKSTIKEKKSTSEKK